MESSNTGGTQPMSIGGRMVRERERLIGMTDEERAWRARYLKSLVLAPEEPITSEEYYKEKYNPIRRFYKWPANKLEALLCPLVGQTSASVIRAVSSKVLMSIIIMYGGWYYLKYNTATWMRQSGMKVIPTRAMVLPGPEGFKPLERPKHFAVHGFDKSPI